MQHPFNSAVACWPSQQVLRRLSCAVQAPTAHLLAVRNRPCAAVSVLWAAPCRHSYVEGRLRLAEKERARRQSRAAAPSVPAIASVPEGSGSDAYDLAQLEAQANANMAALLLEEASSKVG